MSEDTRHQPQTLPCPCCTDSSKECPTCDGTGELSHEFEDEDE